VKYVGGYKKAFSSTVVFLVKEVVAIEEKCFVKSLLKYYVKQDALLRAKEVVNIKSEDL